MKRFLLKVTNFIINTIITVGALTTVFGIAMQFLPAEITETVMGFLNTNVAIYIPASITTTITAIVLVIAKYGNQAIKLMLKDSEFRQEQQRQGLENSVSTRLNESEQRDYAVVQLLNKSLDVLNAVQEQNNNIITYNQIVAQKNLSSNLVPKQLKAQLENWQSNLSKAEQIKEKIVIEDIPQNIDEQLEEIKKQIKRNLI